MGRNSSDHSQSPVRNHRSSHRRDRSPPQHKSSHSTRSPGKERPSSSRHPKPPPTHSPVKEKHSRSSKHTRSRSRSPKHHLPVPSAPVKETSRSPSPRSKRLRRNDKSSERGHDKSKTRSPPPVSNHSRSPSPRTRRLQRAQSDKTSHKDKDSENDRHDRKSGRSTDGNGSSKGHKSRHRFESPPPAARDEGNNSIGDNRNGNDEDDSVAQMKAAEEALATKEKQKPSFELSGKLAAETNRVKGVTLLFTEPPDARKPEVRWRLYVFKNGEALSEPLYVHRQTCYLFGRERRVADIPTDHPSCSKQHAVLQYRQVDVEQPDGMLAKKIRPYIMDLGSTNGTFINENRIEAERYYELMEKDTIKFGNSSREYVLLHENSA
ncbi:hypothetical protein LXL04_030759 [Taraxacum kok-saghyz]